MDDEFWSNLMQHTMDLYVVPEIQRRANAREVQLPFALFAAQVIMNVGEPPQVRLNGEVSAVFKGQLPGATPSDIGKPVSLDDLETIEGMQLLPSDPNAGHITMLLHRGSWFITFDLRYNRARILEYLEVADEYLGSAVDSLSMSRLRPFVDNLLAAAEHLARCYLMLHPDEALLRKDSSHNLVQTRFNQQSKFGNVDRRYVRLLNTLFELRKPARYLTRDFILMPWDADELLGDARALRREVEERLPSRYPRTPSA
jgi:hypothetical protein